MPPKLSLADQKKALKLKEQRAKDKEKGEKDKERAERKALESKDKIFGLKNKHTSKTVQGFVQDVERNLKQIPGEQQKAEAKAREKAKKAAAEAQAQKELEEIMGTAIKQPKVPEGVDPKTIMCEFFKKGRCAKEWKCKFSHERGGRKDKQLDLFKDTRDEEEKAKDEDSMEDWDQAKLESVVAEKHGGENLNNKTTISCKHFLDAVEKRLYGWFWVCPGGGKDCKYRHALPPGYVLKSQLAALAAEEKSALLARDEEEILEERRAALGEGLQLNKTLFLEWKEERDKQRAREKREATEARHREGRMSGRELCEAGMVESGGHEEAGAMEYVKRDTSADDAAEAKAREEAEKNLARMRAMFAASGGVEGGDRSEWFASGGGGGGGSGGDEEEEEEEDDFFVDEDDMDEDELAAMLGQVTVGGTADGAGAGAGAGASSSSASGEAGSSAVGSSNRARGAAAAAARRKLQQDEEALSGFLSNLDGEGGGGGEGAKFVGTIKHREKDPNKKSKLPKKGGGGKGGDSDSDPEEELDPELQAMLAKRADKSSQLRDVKLDTGLVTKSGAKSKALLAAEAKQQQEAAAAAAKEAEGDPSAVDDDDDPFAVDDDDVDLDELVAVVKRR